MRQFTAGLVLEEINVAEEIHPRSMGDKKKVVM
jgi:hypothetical protein